MLGSIMFLDLKIARLFTVDYYLGMEEVPKIAYTNTSNNKH